jgi:hypothetical protein
LKSRRELKNSFANFWKNKCQDYREKMEKEKKTLLENITKRKRFWECTADQKSGQQNGRAPIKMKKGGA